MTDVWLIPASMITLGVVAALYGRRFLAWVDARAEQRRVAEQIRSSVNKAYKDLCVTTSYMQHNQPKLGPHDPP